MGFSAVDKEVLSVSVFSAREKEKRKKNMIQDSRFLNYSNNL
jgi:hypothetical protein